MAVTENPPAEQAEAEAKLASAIEKAKADAEKAEQAAKQAKADEEKAQAKAEAKAKAEAAIVCPHPEARAEGEDDIPASAEAEIQNRAFGLRVRSWIGKTVVALEMTGYYLSLWKARDLYPSNEQFWQAVREACGFGQSQGYKYIGAYEAWQKASPRVREAVTTTEALSKLKRLTPDEQDKVLDRIEKQGKTPSGDVLEDEVRRIPRIKRATADAEANKARRKAEADSRAEAEAEAATAKLLKSRKPIDRIQSAEKAAAGGLRAILLAHGMPKAEAEAIIAEARPVLLRGFIDTYRTGLVDGNTGPTAPMAFDALIAESEKAEAEAEAKAEAKAENARKDRDPQKAKAEQKAEQKAKAEAVHAAAEAEKAKAEAETK